MAFLAQREHTLMDDSPSLLPLNCHLPLAFVPRSGCSALRSAVVFAVTFSQDTRRSFKLVPNDSQCPDPGSKVGGDVCIERAALEGDEGDRCGMQFEQLIGMDIIP